MDMLRVGVGSVGMMALRWREQAAELVVNLPPLMELACQPSVAAVNAGHVAVAIAADSLTGRVESTAARVATGDARYIANETTSASELAAVVDPLSGRQ
ncbi:hypothetical protein [Mycobacterium attenuatum]|uniref:hypothetical protein n=1 Tax=Mycobacterium attenuatum TaxID=2341086 RepID=UPI0010A9567F|nr:hypothetical protein [Mycobacterium attenuatum]